MTRQGEFNTYSSLAAANTNITSNDQTKLTYLEKCKLHMTTAPLLNAWDFESGSSNTLINEGNRIRSDMVFDKQREKDIEARNRRKRGKLSNEK